MTPTMRVSILSLEFLAEAHIRGAQDEKRRHRRDEEHVNHAGTIGRAGLPA
jgi:hypothetical protein